MSLLETRDLSLTRGGRPVLRSVSLRVEAGECVGLLGPNGAGKSSFFRAALGLSRGTGHSSLAALPPRARARHAAFMPQSREIAWPVPVRTLVTLGRLPHLGPGARPGPADRAAVDAALDRMDLSDLADRPATELSGGEQARVLIARLLAQDAALLMADEPAAGLDPAHQIGAMARFSALAAEGRGVILALHDLGLAARHCSRIVLMSAGRVVADGPPRAILTPDRLAEVFGITAHVAETGAGLLVQPQSLIAGDDSAARPGHIAHASDRGGPA